MSAALIFVVIGIVIFAMDDCKEKCIAATGLPDSFYFELIGIPILIAGMVVLYMTWGVAVSRGWSLCIVNTQRSAGPATPEVRFCGQSGGSRHRDHDRAAVPRCRQ